VDAGVIWTQFQNIRDYKQQEGMISDWQQSVDFMEGRQWPPATERTRNLPRPVFNVCRQIVNHKVSATMADNLRMVFSPEEAGDGKDEVIAEVFSRYADTTWENVKQNALNEIGLTYGATRGSAIWHYYWDTGKYGGKTLKYKGDICGEPIDPMNFFPGNPKCSEIQKQPYLLIATRMSVEHIKEIARENKIAPEIIAMITPDKNNDGYDSQSREARDDDKATVLVRYEKDRKSGRVKFTKSTRSVVFLPEKEMPLTLYPIAAMQWEYRSDQFFGLDEVSQIIPNQKLINFLMAMQSLSAQLTGWPKLIYKSDSMDIHKITNAPGEMIEDKSPDQNFAVRYLSPPAMPSGIQSLVDNTMMITKNLSGATETSTGEANMMGRMNATAIMLLQKASSIPLESIKRRFYQAMEDAGNVWADMWKGYYTTERVLNLRDDQGERRPVPMRLADFKDMPLTLKIDIGPASMWSENLAQTTLDKFLEMGAITVEDYLDLVPQNVAPFKAKLKRILAERKQQMPPEAMGMPPGMEAPPQMPQMPPEMGQIEQMPPIMGGIPPQVG